jgi:hypothetical protein
MTLTEEDRNWILEMLGKVQQQQQQSNNVAAGPRPVEASRGVRDDLSKSMAAGIDQATKTGEQLLVGGVRLAGLGLSVIAKITQVTTKAVGAGVDMYVDELSNAMMNQSKKRERSFPLS